MIFFLYFLFFKEMFGTASLLFCEDRHCQFNLSEEIYDIFSALTSLTYSFQNKWNQQQAGQAQSRLLGCVRRHRGRRQCNVPNIRTTIQTFPGIHNQEYDRWGNISFLCDLPSIGRTDTFLCFYIVLCYYIVYCWKSNENVENCTPHFFIFLYF